jgi:hypothetical protein
VDTTRRLETLRHQLDGELVRLEEASRELRTRLRPRARALAPAAAGRRPRD